MRKDSQVADFYRRKELQRKNEAKRPVSEKLAIASRLRDVQERLAPVRVANKAKRSQRRLTIRVRPDQD
jgi:hypothetical protein